MDQSVISPAIATGNRKESYYAYLNSKDWEQKRKACFQIWGTKCLVCRGKEGVQVHHLRYRKWTDVIPKRDLIPICKVCHCDLHDCVNAGLIGPKDKVPWKMRLAVFRFYEAGETQIDPERFKRFKRLVMQSAIRLKKIYKKSKRRAERKGHEPHSKMTEEKKRLIKLGCEFKLSNPGSPKAL